jgi:hypothetical protein
MAMALWDVIDMQWKHLIKVQDPIEKSLFFNFTYIKIGDGKNIPFWDARWLLGSAPKLYKLARFKNRSVHMELNNSNWIRNLGDINTPDLLEEFVTLHMAISTVNLTEDKDQIFWTWTADRKYLVAMTYRCQFHGTMTFFPGFSYMDCHNRAQM